MDHTLTLLVDGYISRTFNSRATEVYFSRLLKRTDLAPYWVLSYTGTEGHVFVIDSVPAHIPPRPPSNSHWVLDRSLVATGTVVPQTMWSPFSVEDRRRLVDGEELQMPIFFQGTDGKLGLSLELCAAGRCDRLADAQRLAPLAQRSVINIRIVWLGYKPFKCEVQMRDERKETIPVTIAGFAHHVARAVDAFLKTCEPDPACFDPRCKQWKIGRGGIERNNIKIVGVVEVSAGSWMPLLQLNRYVI